MLRFQVAAFIHASVYISSGSPSCVSLAEHQCLLVTIAVKKSDGGWCGSFWLSIDHSNTRALRCSRLPSAAELGVAERGSAKAAAVEGAQPGKATEGVARLAERRACEVWSLTEYRPGFGLRWCDRVIE